MSKKKSKGPKTNPKAALAQQQNDYLKRLSAFCKAFFDEDIIGMLPRQQRDIFFAVRIRSVAVEATPDHPIPDMVIKAAKTMVISHLKSTKFETPKTSTSVTLYDVCTLGLQMYYCIEVAKELSFKNSDKVYDLLEKHFGEMDLVVDQMNTESDTNFFFHIQFLLNSFTNGCYTFTVGLPEQYKNDKFSQNFSIKIRCYPSEKEKFVIKSHTRPAYRVGWAFSGDRFIWIPIAPEKLGIETSLNNFHFPVYIQSHALNRLEERIDCLNIHILKEGIISSLCKCVATPGGNDNEFLIEYRILNVKVGYLKTTLIDGKLLIRTFLFLTFKDTPEGQRLETHLGLSKLDTIYLKMDRLSTFMTDHLKHNTELRNLFIKADCSDLLNLHDQLDSSATVHPLNSPLEKLTGYLTANNIELPNWEAIAVD